MPESVLSPAPVSTTVLCPSRSAGTSDDIPGSATGVTDLGPGTSLGGLFLTVLRRRVGGEVLEQVAGCGRHLGDGLVERSLVGLRRLAGPADLADVLQRSGVDLVLGRGWLEVVEGADVSAHVREFTWRDPPASRSRPPGQLARRREG